jgi:hypothetical protein
LLDHFDAFSRKMEDIPLLEAVIRLESLVSSARAWYDPAQSSISKDSIVADNQASKRCDLTAKVVEEAIEMALAGKTPRFDFRDNSQPYFVLRVRAHSLSWLVKTRANSIKIGNAMPPQYASIGQT